MNIISMEETMKIEKIIFPIEEIYWLDAQSSMENWHMEEIKNQLEPIQSKSIGYLIHETKTYIILGFLMFSNEMCKHHQLIPKGMILKRRKIEEANKNEKRIMVK